MAKIELSTQINAPVDRVFDLFTDFEHMPDRVPQIKRLELLTDGPVGKGTRFRETRVMFGKEATETLEVTDFQPGRRCAIGCDTCGSRFDTVFTFRPQGGGTLVEQVTTCTPLTFMARMMTPLSLVMMGPMKKAMQGDLDTMKRIAELAPA